MKDLKGQEWQTEAYWKLSENRRHAIDRAKMKAKHSDFWYKLQTLNDKIVVFRSMYYEKMTLNEKHFLIRKQKAVEREKEKKKQDKIDALKLKEEMDVMKLAIKSNIQDQL